MDYSSKWDSVKSKSIILVAVIGIALFLVGFWLARSTATAASQDYVARHYQFLQVGDTVAAIDTNTGEAYAIDGHNRSWTLLAPPLPAAKPSK